MDNKFTSNFRAFIKKILARLVGNNVLISDGVKVQDINKYPECCLVGQRTSRNPLGEWYLTGILIHPRVVLTSGHVSVDEKLDVVALPILNKKDVNSSHLYEIEQNIIHPIYREKRYLDRGNDIAILILKGSINSIPTPEIALVDRIEPENSKVTIVGFGSISGRFSEHVGVKRETTVDIRYFRLESRDDFSNQETVLGFDATLEFVAGGKEGDACMGDSGGPAYTFINGQKKLLGLISRPVRNSLSQCGGGSIYTRLDMKSEWIKRTLNSAGISF